MLSFPDAMQEAEVMAKVGEQVRNAEDEAERRIGVLGALEGIASMRAECAWLASYEKDDARFKVNVYCNTSLIPPADAVTFLVLHMYVHSVEPR